MWSYLGDTIFINPLLGYVENKAGTLESRFLSAVIFDILRYERAWLEAADGTRHPIKGSCSVGRAGANTIVFESPKVSRRHALIHLQNIGELWLIDFGSITARFATGGEFIAPFVLTHLAGFLFARLAFASNYAGLSSEFAEHLTSGRKLRRPHVINVLFPVAHELKIAPMSTKKYVCVLAGAAVVVAVFGILGCAGPHTETPKPAGPHTEKPTRSPTPAPQ